MIILGDSIEGTAAILILLLASILVSIILYIIFDQNKSSSIEQELHPNTTGNIYNVPQPSQPYNSTSTINNAYNSTNYERTPETPQEKPIHICYSDVNDIPPKTNHGFYGEDMLLKKESRTIQEPQNKFSIEDMADGLAELCIKELLDIMNICDQHQVQYDEKRLIIATFCYYYTIWIFNFDNITVGQAENVEKIYTKHFCNFNRKKFEDLPFREVVENEDLFDKLLKQVDRRIRISYQSHNHTFVDDGISDEYILEFILDANDKEKIKPEIVYKILKDWVYVAHKAGEQSSIV